jgi:hypothetical protein
MTSAVRQDKSSAQPGRLYKSVVDRRTFLHFLGIQIASFGDDSADLGTKPTGLAAGN